jgi:thiamine-monophosphate kinase
MKKREAGEFETIAALFAPLALGRKAALGLGDDAACLVPPPGCDLVVTADALVAGVHFFADDPPATIARKALRCNLSDLAAKGAKPFGYFLTLALPVDFRGRTLQKFARGLAIDGALFGIPLLGGDTTSTPGPLTISITAIGTVKHATMLCRDGAKPGDDLWMSGTLGDAALGLLDRNAVFLRRRYDRPEPRLALGQKLVGIASACMDISDGLGADLGHLCERSKLGADVELAKLPLSRATMRALKRDPHLLESVVAGGDDYELLFAAPPSRRQAVLRAAAASKTQATPIGRFAAKPGRARFLDASGAERRFARAGFTHF